MYFNEIFMVQNVECYQCSKTSVFRKPSAKIDIQVGNLDGFLSDLQLSRNHWEVSLCGILSSGKQNTILGIYADLHSYMGFLNIKNMLEKTN